MKFSQVELSDMERGACWYYSIGHACHRSNSTHVYMVCICQANFGIYNRM